MCNLAKIIHAGGWSLVEGGGVLVVLVGLVVALAPGSRRKEVETRGEGRV